MFGYHPNFAFWAVKLFKQINIYKKTQLKTVLFYCGWSLLNKVLLVFLFSDAINEMAQSDPDKEQTQVLVTGSLLLLGNVLQIVEPNLLFKSSPDEELQVLESYK